MKPPSEDREEKELVSSSPDSGIGETDAQGRKLTEASVCQHNTQAQNCFANTLNPFFYKYQSVDNRKWALLKSLSQDSEYSLDDSLYDAEDILSELGFAGSRDPTIPERFLPSLMQRLSKFPESEMMTLNDRIVHSIGCFKRKEGKRRLFRNLSTGKDPLSGTSHQSSLTCPASNNYPLLRSNTGPAAFTYDDVPPGTTNNSLPNKQPVENEESLPQSPIAILVSQASIDASSSCDGLDNVSCIDTTAASRTQASVFDAQPMNGKKSDCDEAKMPQDIVEDTHLSSSCESTEQVDFRKSNNSSLDSIESFSREDNQAICESTSVSSPTSSSDVTIFEPEVKNGVSNIQKIPLRRASSPQSLDTISKLSDNLRNLSMTGLDGEAKIASSFDIVESSIQIPKFSYSSNEEYSEYSYEDLSSEISSESVIKYIKPEREKQTSGSDKFQFSRTSSLTNFLTSMLSANDNSRCSNSSNLTGKSLQIGNENQISYKKTLTKQSNQQPQEEILSDLKAVETGNPDMLKGSSEVEGLQMDSCKGRVLRRMSWSSQRTHSFEVVDSESESNVNSQYSKLFSNDVPLVEQLELVAETPKVDSLFTDREEAAVSSDCKSLLWESVEDISTEKSLSVISRNDNKFDSLQLCPQHAKKPKNVLKRHRIMSCPLPKELRSAFDSPAQLSSSPDDLHSVVSLENFHSSTGDGKQISRVNVARRIKEFQNRYSKRSSFSSLSFSKRKYLDQDLSHQTSKQRSPPPSFASISTVSTNDFFPSRASFETSRDRAGCSASEQQMSPEALVEKSEDFSAKEREFRDRLYANSAYPDTPLNYCDDSNGLDYVPVTRHQSWDDIYRMPSVNSSEQFSHCDDKYFKNDEQHSCSVDPHAENSEHDQTSCSPAAIPPLKNGDSLSCLYKSSEQSYGEHLDSSCKVSRISEKDYIKEVTSIEEEVAVGKTEESTNDNAGAKAKLSSMSSEHFSSTYKINHRLFPDRKKISVKASKSLPIENSARNKGNFPKEQACNGNKREAMLERKIHAFSKLLANMDNPALRRRTMDDASGTLNSTSDKRYSARKCFTPPPEVDKLVCLLKTLELQKQEDTCPVYRSEVFMQLDDSGRVSPTHYVACFSMDINKHEKVDSRIGSQRKSQLTSQDMLKTNCNSTGMTKSSTTELPFKEVSKELEELQMSIQKAKETRISASRELHFLQELLSGDSADDHRDRKMKKNERKYDKKTSVPLPETGFQEDMMTASGNTALSDLREKSKKDVLEDTEFWQEEIKKIKEENDRVWQERLNRMEDRLKGQEQELIQAQIENEALQRQLELQRLGASPCHCKTDLQNGHGRADSAFEDDEECNNHKPSTPTHSTRQDCERLQEQLIKTEQRADELNLLLNQKLIELNKLQLTLSKQTKEMIELEKSYIHLQCRFRRGVSKPVVSRLCSRSSPFASKNLFPKPSPPASPAPTSICP